MEAVLVKKALCMDIKMATCLQNRNENQKAYTNYEGLCEFLQACK